MTEHEALIQLLSIRAQLANCGESFIIRATLRDKARTLAARFVDPAWEDGEHPPLRDGKQMSRDKDPHCGF